MISLIICSRSSCISDELRSNVASTIGTEYELVIIDNSQNSYSIFSAYNEGVSKAHGEVLCFMHEDILFHTQDWGKIVERHFEDDSLGLLGVIGGHYLPACPAAWWDGISFSGQLIQGQIIDGEYKTFVQESFSRCEEGKTSIEVASIDGLWFCMPSSIFCKLSFDESTYRGFHFYDADISMTVWEIGKKVKIACDVLLEHKSYGVCDALFYQQRSAFFEKWKNRLPLVKGIASSPEDISDHLELLRLWEEERKEIGNLRFRLDGILNKTIVRFLIHFRSAFRHPFRG